MKELPLLVSGGLCLFFSYKRVSFISLKCFLFVFSYKRATFV